MSVMFPQHSDPLMMDSSSVHSSSDCGRYDALLLSATTSSSTLQEGVVEEEPCRAAEEWLFRGGEKPSGCLSHHHHVPSSPQLLAALTRSSATKRQQKPQDGSMDQTWKNVPTDNDVWSSNHPITLRDRLSLQHQLRKERGGEKPLDAHDAWMVLTKKKRMEGKEKDHENNFPSVGRRQLTTTPPRPYIPLSPSTARSNLYVTSNSIMEKCSSNDKKDPEEEANNDNNNNERHDGALRDPCDNFIDSDPHYTPPVMTSTTTTTTTRTNAKTRNPKVIISVRNKPAAPRLSPPRAPKENSIRLHIYDLVPTETIMRFAWGCDFPIGQCFNAVNDGLYELGTGVYHVGIDVNGIEYAYGANRTKGTTGVFSCIPKHSPGFQYRTTLDLGSRPLVKTSAWVKTTTTTTTQNDGSCYREVVTYMEGREVIRKMAKEYMGVDYDLLRKNCCTFAQDACLRLGVTTEEIPTWFRNLATAGAATQDAFQPITSMLSYVENDSMDDDDDDNPKDSVVDNPKDSVVLHESQTGFEVMFNNKEGRHDDVVVVHVVNPEETTTAAVGIGDDNMEKVNLPRTLSWR